MNAVLPAAIGALSGILVMLLKTWFDGRRKEAEKSEQIQIRYLQPLRLYLEECFTRLHEVKAEVALGSDRAEALALVVRPDEITDKDAQWFNSHGCYLASTAYFIACLFWAIDRVRRNLPYLRLPGQRDTELLNRMFAISHAMLKNHGVYYAIQHSIGTELHGAGDEGPVSYRAFCGMLALPESRPWFDRLLQWLIEVGHGHRSQELENTIYAIRDLSNWLDDQIRGAKSIEARLQSEQRPRQRG